MPTNTAFLLERFASVASASAAVMAAQALEALHTEPNAKRYNRSAAARKERWLQLITIAERELKRLEQPERAPRETKRKPKVVPVAPVEAETTLTSAPAAV